MKKYVLFLSAVLILTSISLVAVQATPRTQEILDQVGGCAVHVKNVMEEVRQICTALGNNQVCYGKVLVNAVARSNTTEFEFDKPGDSVNVSQVRSLSLSALDLAADRWGVAQMRLLVSAGDSPKDVTLLLFGDVSITDASEQQITLDVVVNPKFGVNIRNSPSLNALVVGSVAPSTALRAVGRLADNSWLRVEEAETGRVGWVSSDLVQMVNAAEAVDRLPVHEARSPYFGAMQAFYFESGTSASCGNLVTDGLLIQTPEGVGRVSLLINEVSIELMGGAKTGASAFVEANPSDGMKLDMLRGTANITVNNTTVEVTKDSSVTIPLTENLAPAGPSTQPNNTKIETTHELVLLPLIDEVIAPPSGDASADADTEEVTETQEASPTDTETPHGTEEVEETPEVFPTDTETPINTEEVEETPEVSPTETEMPVETEEVGETAEVTPTETPPEGEEDTETPEVTPIESEIETPTDTKTLTETPAALPGETETPADTEDDAEIPEPTSVEAEMETPTETPSAYP